MTKYATYCTNEQMRRALKLGAPLETCGYFYKQQFGCNTISDTDLHVIMTAEEMCAWLETQGVMVETFYNCTHRHYEYCKLLKGRNGWSGRLYQKDGIGYPTRKEAALAAIDNALNYIEKTRKQT